MPPGGPYGQGVVMPRPASQPAGDPTDAPRRDLLRRQPEPRPGPRPAATTRRPTPGAACTPSPTRRSTAAVDAEPPQPPPDRREPRRRPARAAGALDDLAAGRRTRPSRVARRRVGPATARGDGRRSSGADARDGRERPRADAGRGGRRGRAGSPTIRSLHGRRWGSPSAASEPRHRPAAPSRVPSPGSRFDSSAPGCHHAAYAASPAPAWSAQPETPCPLQPPARRANR